MQFSGKNVLVTGAASGIGKEIALTLAGYGLKVWVNYRSRPEQADAIKAEIEANAMTGFNHREPGCVGAIFDTDITTETIADGIHISYPALKLAYKVKSTDKVMLVSDSMMACCMRDGCYSLGGQDVEVINGKVVQRASNA